MRSRHKIGILLLTSTAMIAPAAAQNGPPSAASLLQAADKAIGASNVKSIIATSTGWRGYPGQQFAQGDLPRSDTKSTLAIDFGGKSWKLDYTRAQGNNLPRGGGAGFPVQGEQHFAELGSGIYAWNLNPQGEPVRQSAADAGDRKPPWAPARGRRCPTASRPTGCWAATRR